MNSKLRAKIIESLSAVLPVTAIVLILSVTVTPMPLDTFMLFLVGACLLIFGMGVFTLGAEMAMMQIGEKIGLQLAKTKRLWSVAIVCCIIGIIITVAEPDLQVLANQVPAVPNFVLILSVAVGVGIFLVIAFFRTLLGWDLSKILIVCYLVVFVLSFFVPKGFLSVAFDSGGVTTGPMTVPFIMSLGLGLASIGKSKNSDGNTFGYISLCSIGPIVSVMILGLLYHTESGSYTPVEIPKIDTTEELFSTFRLSMPEYALEVILAILPIIAFFLITQFFFLKMRKKQVFKIFIGLVYTLVGLTLFLLGVNVGFMPVGNYIGSCLAKSDVAWSLIPLGMLIGYFIVKAEPAVVVLNKQVEEVTEGAISQKVMMRGLSIGMAISVGLAMIRVMTGISILWFLIPGYCLSLGLSFFVPRIFTAIAFDSGGVASGPMTATFLLPFAMGACESLGGSVLTDAFGVVAMVAMTPLVIIQLIGVLYKLKSHHAHVAKSVPSLDEHEIIHFEKEEDE